MSDNNTITGEGPIVLTEEDHKEVLECARYNELDDLKYLLSIGCDVNYLDTGGSSALHKAAANGFVEILEVLRQSGARFVSNQSGNTPLHFACLTGQTLAATWLLKNYGSDCNVFAKNKVGKSAFTEATSGGYEEIARLLLSHSSAEPYKSTQNESTASDKQVSGTVVEKDDHGDDIDDAFGEDVDDAEDDDVDLIDEAEAAAAAETIKTESNMQQ